MICQKKKIAVAVVGLGVGKQHARAYLGTGRCDLRWLYDLDREKAQIMNTELGVGAVAGDLSEILRDPEVHAVSIASYDDAHFEQVVATLKAGKNVFVEKPLCRTINELKIIKEAWARQQGKLTLSSNLVLRASPAYRHLKQLITAGALGEIYAFDGDYLYGRLHKITDGWRQYVVDYSVMLGGGIHLVDLMLWLTGQYPTLLYAQGNRLCTKGTAFHYLDFVAATLHFPSGLIGRITANFGCVHRHQHVMRVFGTKGTFIYDDQGPRLHTSRDPGVPATVMDLSPLPATKGALIPDFIQDILTGNHTHAQTQHEFDLISVCAAIDRSLNLGATTEVEYV